MGKTRQMCRRKMSVKLSGEMIRRGVGAFCITFAASIFWSFCLAAVLRYVVEFSDQKMLEIAIFSSSCLLFIFLLPKAWELMATY
jgi:hypothetical protein